MVIYQMVDQSPLVRCFVYRYIFTCLLFFGQNRHVMACRHSKIFYRKKGLKRKMSLQSLKPLEPANTRGDDAAELHIRYVTAMEHEVGFGQVRRTQREKIENLNC